jgi:hypothetical protein
LNKFIGQVCFNQQSKITNFLQLGFDGGFVDEHDGDVVFDGVDAVALRALEALGVLAVVEGLLAGGANQKFQ